MSKPKSSKIVRAIVRVALLLCIGILTKEGVLAQAGECSQAEIKTRFGELHKNLDAADGDQQSSFTVFQKVESEIATAFHSSNPRCVAECIFGSVALASRLTGGHLITQQASDSVYAYLITSKDTADIAFYLFAVGILEFSRGDRTAARMWFDSVLTFPRYLHNGDTYASALKVRGFVNKYDGRNEEALRDFYKAAKIYAEEHNDLKAEIDILAASAEIQIERGDSPPEVLKTVERSIHLFEANKEQFSDWEDAYNIYTSYARVLSEVGNHEEADRAGREALKLVEARDDKFRIAIVYIAIAEYLYEVERLEEARHHAMMGYESFKKISKTSHVADALALLIQIDNKLENYKSALDFSFIRERITDSLTRTSHVFDIRRMEQTQAQAKTLSELAIEQARSKTLVAERSEARMTLWLIIAALGLVGSFSLVLTYRLRERGRMHDVLEKVVETRTVELREHAESLEEKNIELERFAFIASHDLKTPLRNITSFVDLAKRRMSDQARTEIGEYLDIATSYARQMNYIICDVLEFSESEREVSKNRSRQQLRILVDHAMKIAVSEFQHLNPIISVDGNAEVLCNKEDVEQILLRLIHNALKFNESAVPILNVSISRNSNDFIEIVVEDNGIGIRPEYAEEVFGLFKRLNLQEEYPGTGLGLSFARKLARRMQGDVVLHKSEVGQGSTFVLRLPALPRNLVQARLLETIEES